MKSIKIPSGIESIGNQAFYGCSSLTSVIFKGGVPSTQSSYDSSYVFYNSPSTARGYYPAAFAAEWQAAINPTTKKWQGLVMEGLPQPEFDYEYDEQTGRATLISYNGSNERVTVPAKVYVDASGFQTDDWNDGKAYQVVRIAKKAFADNKTLKVLIVPDSVEEIEEGAFWGCNLQEVSLGVGVTDIPAGLFANMTALTTVVIRGTITGYIGGCAFYGCTALENITGGDRMMPSSVFMQAFYGVPASFKIDLSKCTYIGVEAFCGCSGFKGSSSTATLSLPVVEEIWTSAFEGCTSIAAVELGSKLTGLGTSAFKDSGVRLVSFAGEPPSMGESPFEGLPKGAEGYAPQEKAKWWDVIDSKTGMWCGLYFPGFVNSYSTLLYVYEAINDSSNEDGRFDKSKVSAVLSRRVTGKDGVVSGVVVGKYKVDHTGVCRIREMNSGEYVVTFVYDDDSWVCSGPETETVTFPLGDERQEIVYFRRKSADTDRIINVELYDEDHDETPYRVHTYGSEGDVLRDVKIPMYTLPLPSAENKIFWAWSSDWGEYVLQWHYYKDKKVGAAITDASITIKSDDERLNPATNRLLLYAKWDWIWRGDALEKAHWQYSQSAYEEQTALQNKKIGDGEKCDLVITSAEVSRGKLEFVWSTSCESAFELPDGTTTLRDHAEFLVDDTLVATLDGETDWTTVSVDLDGAEHTLTWRYSKDGNGSEGEDCVRVSGLRFVEDEGVKADGSYSETIDGYTWYYDVKDGGATIAGMNGWWGRAISPSPTGELTIPVSLGGCPVTSIGDYAFVLCEELESVVMPSSVTNIGMCAFSGCSGLESVAIPESVTRIGAYAFDACMGLKEVTIPSGVARFGENAFELCNGLINVTISEGVTHLGVGMFTQCIGLKTVTIPSSLTNIGESTFCLCSGIEKFVVADANPNYKSVNGLLLTKDGKELIIGVNGEVTIPDGVECIDYCAFGYCSTLTLVTIPSSVTNIGDSAFWLGWGDGNLNAVDFEGAPPKGVGDAGVNQDAAIRYNAAYEDEWLPMIEACGWTNATAYVPDGSCSEAIDGYVWHYYLTDDGARIYTVEPEEPGLIGQTAALVVPAELHGEYVYSIGANAFSDCTGMRSLTIPEETWEIDAQAFGGCGALEYLRVEGYIDITDPCMLDGCTNLHSVAIPADSGLAGFSDLMRSRITDVELIGESCYIVENAFAGCTALEEINIPDTVVDICKDAFLCCRSLKSIDLGPSFEYVDQGALAGCSRLTVNLSGSNSNWMLDAGLLYSINNYGDIWSLAFAQHGDSEVVIADNGLNYIEDRCFYGNTNITSITIPKTIYFIGKEVFAGCCNLTEIAFKGDAPYLHENVFSDVASGCTAVVYEGTDGWDDDGDGMWQGLKLVYRSFIPDLGDDPTEDEVYVALADLVDEKLLENVTDGATYNDFRDWAEKVKDASGSAAGAQSVKESPNAWVSFALGSETLLEEPPTDEDLKIEAFEHALESGKFDFTVSVKDVEVGSEAAAENLKKVFGLEGGSSLQGLSSDNVDITFGTPVDGKVKFTAGPNAANADAKTFFMKVKMNP